MLQSRKNFKRIFMLNADFENKLKELGLNKRDFSELCGLGYTTITNWRGFGKTPEWVESYLEFYDKARKYDEIKAKLGL